MADGVREVAVLASQRGKLRPCGVRWLAQSHLSEGTRILVWTPGSPHPPDQLLPGPSLAGLSGQVSESWGEACLLIM